MNLYELSEINLSSNVQYALKGEFKKGGLSSSLSVPGGPSLNPTNMIKLLWRSYHVMTINLNYTYVGKAALQELLLKARIPNFPQC